MRCNLKNFLAEIEDQSWEMPNGMKVIYVRDVVIAEKRIEAELRERLEQMKKGAPAYYDEQSHGMHRMIKEILGE